MKSRRVLLACAAVVALSSCDTVANFMLPNSKSKDWTEEEKARYKRTYEIEGDIQVLHFGVVEGIVLPKKNAPAVMNQCSRHFPIGRFRIWQPEQGDIALLEAKLPEYVNTHLPQWATRLPWPLENYRRQYLGLESEGHKYIYVS